MAHQASISSSITSSEAADGSPRTAGRFLVRLACFLAPYAAFGVVVLCLLQRTGELMSVRTVAWLQSLGWHFIYETKFADHSFRLKVEAVKRQRPDVVVMGTSRAAGWRRVMFRPLSFYNAGRAAYPQRDLTRMLEELGDYSPRVIVFGLDFFTFHPLWDPIFTNRAHDDLPAWGSPEQAALIKAMLNDARRQPFALFRPRREAVHHRPALGVRAAETSTGTRIDGSLQYGALILGRDEPLPIKDTLVRIAGGFPPFPLADRLQPERLRELEEFAALARRRHIHLIGVAMGYAPEALAALDASERHRNWRQFQQPAFAAWVRSLGITFFNFTYLESFGGKPDEFVDAFHPSEPANVRMLVKMLEDPTVRGLLPGIDRARLQRALATSSRYDAFPDEY